MNEQILTNKTVCFFEKSESPSMIYFWFVLFPLMSLMEQTVSYLVVIGIVTTSWISCATHKVIEIVFYFSIFGRKNVKNVWIQNYDAFINHKQQQ